MQGAMRDRFLSDGFADEFSEEFIASLTGPVTDGMSGKIGQLLEDLQRAYTPDEERMISLHRCCNGLPLSMDGTLPYTR